LEWARSLLPEDFAEGDAVTRQELLSKVSILESSFVLHGWSCGLSDCLKE